MASAQEDALEYYNGRDRRDRAAGFWPGSPFFLPQISFTAGHAETVENKRDGEWRGADYQGIGDQVAGYQDIRRSGFWERMDLLPKRVRDFVGLNG